MYQGSYQNNPQRRRRRNRKPTLLMLALAILLVAVVGTTIAYLFTNTGSITNTFTPANVTTEITEDFNNNVKNNVQVKNTGDVEAYIRAAVVVTWQNDAGEVYPTAPVEGTDYTVSYPGNGWVKHTDGYYYYTSPVAAGASTGILLTDCKPVDGKAPDDYHLVVEILASAIQSKPDNAVTDAWGINPTTLGGNAA